MIAIESARPSDLPAVRDLIESVGLPLDGFGEVPTEVFVAREGESVVGTASLETHGGDGLLRSVAVDELWRGDGIGDALVRAAEVQAHRIGLAAVYLLTDTAGEFFAGRGYLVIDRDAGPVPIMASIEWSVACGETAIPMMLPAAAIANS